MIQPQPSAERAYFTVDLLGIAADRITVRDRNSGRTHIVGYSGLAIGANEAGEGYTLILPRHLAITQGMIDAA